ncbi:polysaccharide deacetylase family protein [Oceanobacillus locisalsi]|uniref:Polysaccharide deacetylase family protein n=1 Tax=Oceanobacillus locisalsi TaxID=546107 RepID=A0ABW3NHY8_9BACI
MKLNRTEVIWDRTTRNELNENWDTIEDEVNGLGENVSVEVLNRLTDRIKDLADTAMVNEALNGDFSEGTEGLFAWAAYSGTSIRGQNGKLIMTGDGANRQVRVRQSNGYGLSEMSYTEGHKLYIQGDFKVLASGSTGVGFEFYGSEVTGTIHSVVQNVPEANKDYKVSDIVELKGGAGKMIIQIKTFFASAPEANGKSTEVDKILVLDLTKIFGAGNEPSNEEMDYLMSYYDYNWFDMAGAGKMALAGFKLSMENRSQDDTELNIINDVQNGNFETANSWLALSGTTISASDNALYLIGTGSNNLVRAYQITDIPYRLGDKIYVRGEFEVDNDECKMAGFYLRSSGVAATNETFFRKTAPRRNELFEMSGIMDVWDGDGAGSISVYLRADYTDSASARDNKLSVRKVIAVNLTEAFGAGNEPTDREEFDKLIRRYPDRFFDYKPKSGKWQIALTNYQVSNLRKPKVPLIAFTIDDGNLTDYITAYPLFNQKGIKGTSYLVNKWVDSNDNRFLNRDMIHEMYENGWDFQCHTANHNHFTDYATDQEIRNEFIINNQSFADLSLPHPEHHAYPFGDYNRRVIDIGLQYRKSLRATGMTSGIGYNEYDRPNYGALNARSIDIGASEISRLTEIKNVIDETVKNNGALILYMHQVKDNPDDQYQAQLSVVTEIIDYALTYINSGKLQSVTHSELFETINNYQI